MVRIFPDRIRIRSDLEGFYPSVSDSEYSIFVIDPYLNTKKLHFYDIDIHYNLIQQKLTLSVFDSVFEQKYENKYDINNIRLSVFEPFTTLFGELLQLYGISA